jgi:tight adherence protein B
MTLWAVSALVLISAFLLIYGASRGLSEYRSQFTESAKISMEDMFVFIDPNKVFMGSVALVLVVPITVWLFSGAAVLAAISAVFVLAAPRTLQSFLIARRKAKIIEQLPDAMYMLAGSLKAGTSIQIGLDLMAKETPAPLAQEISLVLRETRLGVALEDSLQGMAKRLKLEDVNLVVSAMTIAKEVGGNLAEILERLASTLRAKAVMEGKIRALTSQGKLQGIVVGLLPVFLALVLFQMEPEAMSKLFSTWYGWATVAVIAVFLSLGAFMIRKIVSIDI